MPKIGIVLAGAASKGAYEIGCLRAIEERFGAESIKYISSASIGSLIAQAYGMGKLELLIDAWEHLDVKKHGRFFLSFSGDGGILDMICNAFDDKNELPFEHYVSVWNYTQHRSEYIPFHELSTTDLQHYMKGAIAIPIFSKGEFVNGDRILDGAFLDNIPVYPLIDKDIDYVFCIYFDNYKYFFESEEFDSKVIKVFDFPNEKMLELMTFNPENLEGMINYGYKHMNDVMDRIFVSDDKEQIMAAIKEYDNSDDNVYQHRLTADVVLNNINVVTKRYSKRLSNRKKEK